MAESTVFAPAVLNGVVSGAVSPFERISNALFGCPSIRRANGGFKTRFIKKVSFQITKRDRCGMCSMKKGASSARKSTVVPESDISKCIFSVDRITVKGKEVLPRIWLSEGRVDKPDEDKRDLIASYPNGEDEGGLKALELAERMLGEGFGKSDMNPTQRKRFFQAAEILLLHSVDRGNIDAALRLGDIYRFDLCKGEYWKSEVEDRAQHASPISKRALQRKAWIMYSMAAKRGSALAYIGLADIEMDSGSAEVLGNAFLRYTRAYDLMLEKLDLVHKIRENNSVDDPEIELDCRERRDLGLALLRLAGCFERGLGCTRSISIAKKLYECSKMNLENAFVSGCWHNKKDLIEATKGFRRCIQESQIGS